MKKFVVLLVVAALTCISTSAFAVHEEESTQPGIVKTELTRFFAGPLGEPPYYMMFEAYFADRDSLNAALASPENRAAGKDLSFAKDIVTVMFADVYESGRA